MTPKQNKQKHKQKDKQALLYDIWWFCLVFDIGYLDVVHTHIQRERDTNQRTREYIDIY